MGHANDPTPKQKQKKKFCTSAGTLFNSGSEKKEQCECFLNTQQCRELRGLSWKIGAMHSKQSFDIENSTTRIVTKMPF